MLRSLKANILGWEMLLHKMAKLGRVIRWEHIPTHINLQGGGELRPGHNPGASRCPTAGTLA